MADREQDFMKRLHESVNQTGAIRKLLTEIDSPEDLQEIKSKLLELERTIKTMRVDVDYALAKSGGSGGVSSTPEFKRILLEGDLSVKLTGTVSVNISVNAKWVNGTGTQFLSELEDGAIIQFDNEIHEVVSVQSNILLIIDDNHPQTVSGVDCYTDDYYMHVKNSESNTFFKIQHSRVIIGIDANWEMSPIRLQNINAGVNAATLIRFGNNTTPGLGLIGSTGSNYNNFGSIPNTLGMIHFGGGNIILANFSVTREIEFLFGTPLVTKGKVTNNLLAHLTQMSIGTFSPNSNTLLDITGNKAVYLPRLTTTQRDALTPANGFVIYNTTVNRFQFYQNGTWTNLHITGASGTFTTTDGKTVTVTNGIVTSIV
jgi:hypothetical protein